MEKWKLIGIGFSGWHAKRKNSSCSSYYKDLATLESFVKDAEEGAVVYDASNANLSAFVNFVSNGPMLDFDLYGKEYEIFSSDSRTAALSMCGPGGLSGGFEKLVYIEAAQEISKKKIGGFGGFDMVSLDLYLNLMREYVPGVRFGKVINGNVVWEDGKNYLSK